MPRFNLIWDLDDDAEGNVWHIAEHGITPAEVEEVLYDVPPPSGRRQRKGKRRG